MKWDFKYVDPKSLKHHPVNWKKAYRYAKDMEKGDKFPPVQIHMDKNGRFIVQNGAHRTMAAKLIDKKLFVRISKKCQVECESCGLFFENQIFPRKSNTKIGLCFNCY